METILSYFGTYTPAADGAIAGFQFEYLTSLGFAAIVMFLGRFIIDHSTPPAKVRHPRPRGLRPAVLDFGGRHQRLRRHRPVL